MGDSEEGLGCQLSVSSLGAEMEVAQAGLPRVSQGHLYSILKLKHFPTELPAIRAIAPT